MPKGLILVKLHTTYLKVNIKICHNLGIRLQVIVKQVLQYWSLDRLPTMKPGDLRIRLTL